MASTEAVHQQCLSLLHSPALPLILQHPSINQQQGIVCRLLCTSKAMQEAVADGCAGQLSVAIGMLELANTPPPWSTAAGFCGWLARNSKMLQTLDINVRTLQMSKKHECAVIVAAALQQAAARQRSSVAVTPTGTQGLLLQSYSGNLCSPEVLQQLPCSSLTRLCIMPACGAEVIDWTLWPHPARRCPATAATNSQDSSAAQDPATVAQQVLAQLSKLQNLTLFGQYADQLLPAVSALCRLTELQLHKLSITSASQLQQLPSQHLQRLTLSVSPNIHGWQRKQLQPPLGQLTALRELSCTGEGLFAVQAHDVLPLQLTALTVVDCPSAQPLLPLKHLQVLCMTACTTCATHLQEISSNLRQLQQVRLTYDRDPEIIKAAAPGWASLPLCDLVLRVYPGPVVAETVQELAKLQGLTRLSIEGYCVKCEVTARQLAGVIGRLSKLRELKLASLRLLPDEPGLQDADPAGRDAVQQQLAGGAAAKLAGVASAVAAPGVSLTGTQLPVSACMSATDAGADTASSSPGMWILMRVIARLPQLHSFSFNQFPLGEAAAGLAAATALTSLKLDECGLINIAVEVLARSLVSLKRLSLSWNFQLNNAVVRPIAVGLGELEELILCSTKVSDLGPLHDRVPPVKVVL